MDSHNERNPDRNQTDESLRLEREKADHALGEELAAIDETADAVITRARARADEVLAAARAKTDRQSPTQDRASRTGAPGSIQTERRLADRILRQERATADETLRDERAEHVALLSRERHDTDHDLATERAQSDHALAMRDEFMGIVSHDLRNLLNAMGGYAALIAEAVLRENHVSQVGMAARRIQQSTTRMNRLVGDLVDIASIRAGRLAVTPEIADPSVVVTEAIEIFQAQASASRISLVAEIVPPSFVLAFDPARILQVLTNLLSNAIKFTPAGGTVVIHVERVGAEVRFAVSDTGPGVPTDLLDAVFDRFLQGTKNDQRGVGLGLYISRAIVEGHGGRIWAENRIGGGSTFCFTLPMQSS